MLHGQRVLELDAFGYGALLTLAAPGSLAVTLFGPAILRHIKPAQAILFGMAVFAYAASRLRLNKAR